MVGAIGFEPTTPCSLYFPLVQELRKARIQVREKYPPVARGCQEVSSGKQKGRPKAANLGVERDIAPRKYGGGPIGWHQEGNGTKEYITLQYLFNVFLMDLGGIWYCIGMAKRETPIQITPDAQLKQQLAALMKKTGLKTRTAVLRLAVAEMAERRGV